VNENVTREHYARLAATYDQNWAHSPEFMTWMTGCIQQRLRITGNDQVIDIGCGTGLYARELAFEAASVVCADSSAPMLEQVPRDGRLIAVNASAQDLASGRVRLPAERFDAMLLKEVLHHVENQGEVIRGLAGLLKPGGRMLVVMLPTTISYPLFGAALELFNRQQPDPAGIAAQMTAAGLEAELDYEGFPLVFPVERYLQMVRDRYMSLLSHFSDAELEAGAGEIRRAHPGDEISFEDRFAFAVGVKA
jgi:ubiquinone/menaquinone biosynthesis C-methylase UbiE